MSEHRLWLYLRTGMGSRWEVQRHEDRLSTGIPDLSYSMAVNGWIELKYLPKIPKGQLTIRHYTVDQRNWLIRHGKRSGLCFLLLQIDREYMIFDWTKVARVGQATFEEHREFAVKTWTGKINWSELGAILSQPVLPDAA